MIVADALEKITSVKGHEIYVVGNGHIYARAEYDEEEEQYGELKAKDTYERFWLSINLMEVKNIHIGLDIIFLEV